MASLAARSASQALRASRRASGAVTKAALRPAQTASYSLLARAAAAKAAQVPAVQVGTILSWQSGKNLYPRRVFVESRLSTSLVPRRPSTSEATGLWLSSKTTSRTTPLLSLVTARKVMARV